MAEGRREGARGDLADDLLAAHHGVAGAGGAAALRGEADEDARVVAGAGLDRGLADERLLGRDDHAPQTRLNGLDARAELVTVERHARLKPEGVARREPARLQAERLARGEERPPQGGGVGDVEVELEAVLARVARAGDEDLDGVVALRPGECAGRPGVVREVVELGGEELGCRLEHRARSGPLHREEGRGVGAVVDRDAVIGGALREGGDHGIPIRCVRDDEVLVIGDAVDDEVVDDAAVLVEDERVLRLADGERRQPAGERLVEEGAGGLADDGDLGHVRDVEEARGRAHRVVLGEVGGVADRHLPAGEVGEARAERDVLLVQGREPRGCGGIGRCGIGHCWIGHGVLLTR